MYIYTWTLHKFRRTVRKDASTMAQSQPSQNSPIKALKRLKTHAYNQRENLKIKSTPYLNAEWSNKIYLRTKNNVRQPDMPSPMPHSFTTYL